MDDRDRRQVEIGAGLQESRLNTELIEWLQKWGPRALYILLAIVLAYLGWTKWSQYQQNQIDKAFAEYQAERTSQNPDVLLAVADKHDGKGAVWTLATLDAADLLLHSGRLGLAPGANLANPEPDQTLGEDQQRTMFQSAIDHYQSVLDRHADDSTRARFAQHARWGIASAAISLGDLDTARTVLNKYSEVAEREGFSENLALARERLETLDNLTNPIPVYSTAQLPEENRPVAPPSQQPGSVNFGPSTPGATPGVTLPDGSSAPIRRIDPSELRDTSGQPFVDPRANPGQPAPADAPTTDEPAPETPAQPQPEPDPDQPADDPE